MNLARLLSESASRHPDKPAVVFEGTSHSYRAFDRQVERYAALLPAEGGGEGEGVAGTPGRSKGAMITHRDLVSNMRALSEAWEWTKEDVLLHVLPLFHVHGLNVATHGSLCAGSTIVMHEKFEPRRVWESLEKERCTLLMAVPTIYQRLMGEWEIRERKPDLHGMRVFISGSAPLSHNLFHRFERGTGFRLLERSGMTETGMNTST